MNVVAQFYDVLVAFIPSQHRLVKASLSLMVAVPTLKSWILLLESHPPGSNSRFSPVQR